VLRAAILYVSRRRGLRRWVEGSGTARRLSSRFVAGKTLEDALAACVKIRSQGITATLDYLGENVSSLNEAVACRDMYLRMLDEMHRAGVEPNVSLKLTQFGLDLSEEACARNLEQLATASGRVNGFIRIDMESSAYTDRTLALITGLHEKHPCCGTVIQAYLHRSAADIADLERRRIRVRLCKGAYLEPPEVAFPGKDEVDRNYIALAKTLLDNGDYPAIATHDEKMLAAVIHYAAANKIPRDRFEFQMLYGIRRDLQKRLVKEGYRLRVYVPFGEAWYPYFMRRLAERPANLWFFVRSLARK
jgi:proline dehydrogenase